MATNLGVYNKTKHIETDWHFVKEKIESSNIVTNFVSSNDSDVCIKFLQSLRVIYVVRLTNLTYIFQLNMFNLKISICQLPAS